MCSGVLDGDGGPEVRGALGRVDDGVGDERGRESGRRWPPGPDGLNPGPVLDVGVEDDVVAGDAESMELAVAEHSQVESFRGLVGNLDEEAVLGGADEEVGGDLDGGVFEEGLESSFLAPAYSVEDGQQRPDDTRTC